MYISDLPYSKESRALFPLWEELAEAFKEREHVVIARMDASANDINMSMQGPYPSLCLFPALYAERVCCVKYLNVMCMTAKMLLIIVIHQRGKPVSFFFKETKTYNMLIRYCMYCNLFQ